jgi:hypothetical protein
LLKVFTIFHVKKGTREMNNEPVAWNGKPLQANTITFNNINSDWVMQITADRKIIVNENVEVSDAAQAVLDALQNLLVTPHPAKTLTDEEITELANEYLCYILQDYETTNVYDFARAILRKAQEK